MAKWIEVRKSGNFEEIGKKHHISPVIARILRNKDICTDEEIEKYLHGDYKDLYSPHLMKDLDKAVEIIKEKITTGEKMRIIGDYDIDGVESTYILYKGLSRCGGNVSYAIPDRVMDGYGINKNLIQKALDDGIKTIVTCDNGIAAIEAIDFAKEKGMTVIVTDHHDIPYEILENGERKYKRSKADAIINPKQKECAYPYKGLCGAGVAYKLIVALYEKFNLPEVESKAFIENAGFATIGDVMDLTDENRILVKIGLQMLRTTTNPGMRALIDLNGLDYPSISSYHVGFVLGPCINASGRLDTARHSLELLLCEDEAKALELAKVLFDYNAERKDLTEKGVEQAEEQIVKNHMEHDKVLIIYIPGTHESIVGIVAGRVREHYYKPVFVLTDTENGVKGSGRSIEEYSMYDEMVKCGRYLDKFGGHPMAAGLSLAKENIEPFRKAMNENCSLTEQDMVEKIKIDAVMPIDYSTKYLYEQLKLLEPCGKANTKPVFAARDVRITGARVLGKNKNVVKLSCMRNDGLLMDGLCFMDAEIFKTRMEEKFGEIETELLFQGKAQHSVLNLLYYPSLNEWQGRQTMQVTISDFC